MKLTATLGQGERFSPQAWLERQRAYLETTIQQLSSEEFERAVEALCSARRVFLHGKNASSSMAQLLYFRLRRLGLQVSLLPSGGSELLEGLAQAAEGDLVVLFSFSKLSREGPHPLGSQPVCRLPDPGLCRAAPACPRKNGRTSACLPTGARKKSTIPWRPLPLCWMPWQLLWQNGWEPKVLNAFSRCIR